MRISPCDFGCPAGARNTVDVTYIARAEQLGASVRELCEVRRLRRNAFGKWEIGYVDLASGRRVDVTAAIVVVSAGVLGSTELLMRNRRALGGLSPVIGSRFSPNGDILAVGFNPDMAAAQDADDGFGPTMTDFVDHSASDGYIIANGALPDGLDSLLTLLRGINTLSQPRQWPARARLLARHLGLADPRARPSWVRAALSASSDRHITDAIVLLLMGRDAADGELRLSRGFRQLDVRWNERASRPLLNAMGTRAHHIFAAAGADPMVTSDPGLWHRPLTVHPLGGLPMADDPSGGVVDQFGQVFGTTGLYVLDGSIVPTAIGVNPSKTIAALAERGIEHLINQGRG